MDNHFEHCSAHVTSLEQDGFLVKIHAQVPSDSGVSGRKLLSRVDQISGHLRRVKCCESISRGQLAFARIEDNFHRVRALGDNVEGRVAVKFIDYGHEDVLLLSDIIVVDPPLSDVLTTVRPLAEEFYLDGILLMRPLSNEEIVILSEKILYRTVSCRLRRLHPELSLIELATPNAAGDRRELFSNIVIELGFGNKCSSEDIAKYLRIKIPARADDPAMQSGRPFVNNPYSIPPPTMLGSQPTTLLGSQTTTMLGSQPTTMLGSQPTTLLGSQPGMTQVTHSSVNARLAKFKRDAALNVPGSGLYSQASSSPPPQLADRKQYTVTDGRTCTTAPTLPVKSTHNAYISHVEDGPFNFTIQLKSSVEDLLPKLRNILVRYQNSPITAQLIPGSVVMAKSSDETLRRGVIMNVQPETCKVYYIDFGNFEELPYSDIFQLPNTAAELSPAMAMQFCLADLKSVKITNTNKDYFARLLLGKQILIRVTERESNSPFQYCEILWEGRSVREILLNLNSPMQYAYQYPPRGREAPVCVIYVDGPSQFFVQYRSELNVVNQIQEALASYCPSQPRVTDLSAINIGSPVASLFPDDQRWYRALVMGMDSTNINVFYVDYGNRAEVNPNQICLLSRDLVNKWKTQAIECCLIGFDTVTPDLFMAEKMEDAALGHSYTLRLHSILSGFRLSVDLLDEQGNSIATNMKNLLNERQKAISHPTTQTENKKAQTSQDDDRLSQHSSDGGGKKNKFQRPGTRGDRGNKLDQRGERKLDDRNKLEERPNSYSQHDDRSGNDYKTRNESRDDWKKGVKKPYMDQENEWNHSSQEPKSYAKKDNWVDKQDLGGGGFKKQEWKHDDKPGWGGDSSNRSNRPDRSDRHGGGFRSDGDRRGGSNRFDRKPFNNDEDGRSGDRGDSWGSRDRKFGDRENKFGDRDNKFGGRDNKFGDRENKFGDREHKFGDRENKFGDRESNRFGSRDNKFGDRDNKFGGRDKPNYRDSRKPQLNEDGAVQRTAVPPEDSWEDQEAQAPVKRSSVVISEYPHQEIKVGQEYKVLFAGMETSSRDVYVQLSHCDPELEKIRSMIDADATATSRPISNAVLAMPVLARFQDDGLLYRATIKSIIKVPSGQVDVLFVDFGNTAVNALSEVFAMSSELMSIPIQAIHVIVTDMPTAPFANLAACQTHFDTDYLTLKPSRTTTIDLEQVIEGTLIRPDGQSVADCVKNDPSCHGEPQIVVATESQLASSAVLESQAPAPEAETSEHPPIVLWRERLDLLLGQRLLAKVVKKCEGDNVYSIKITAVLDLIVPAQSVDPLSRELTQGDGVIVAVDGLADDRLFVKYYNRQGQSLAEGGAIEAIVPMQIVQRKGVYTVSHREGSTLYLQQEDSTTLSNLLESLFEKYEDSPSGTYELKVGDVTAAKSLDENWYRAKISAIVENMYTVHYLDYGNNEEIKVENLRKLDEEFSSPEMCVSVELPVTYKDMEGCIETLGEGPFECTFIKLDSINGVWIADICSIGELNENFSLKWIEAGKAESMSNICADPGRREPCWNLKKSDRVPIIISHIELPDIFFAHHLEQSNYVQALQDEIQDLPEGGDLGEVFIAKFTEDSMWYRAVRCGDQVRFVDYGNLDPSVEMKNLPANWIHPAKGYAMPLRLCVQASGVEWTPASAQIFDDFIDKSGLEAEIISVDFETIVDLRSGDESLSAIYIDGGHAVHFIPPLNDDLGGCVLEDDLPVGKVAATVTAITTVNDFYVQENSKIAILDLLASKLEGADSFEVVENPSQGQCLVAKFVDDDIWYRAKVTHQDPIEVLFVDYGNTSPATEFRVLPLDLAAFPSLAWHCSVDVEDTPANNDLFTSLVDANTVFDVSFVEKKDDLHVVQLSIDSKNPFELSTISENNNSELSTSTVEQMAKLQVKPIPPALTKPLYKDCVLCHSNGPYDFYVQTDDDHIQIDEMANALFEAGSFPKIDSVKKGDFVVAQFTEDDAYYRAIVTDIEPEVVVHFIDYGNSCPASCFHELPAPLKEIPQLAVRCSLQSPVGGWSVDDIDKFTSLLNPETKSFDLKILSRGDPTVVDVEINGSSITKQLAPDAKFEPDSTQEAPSAVTDEGVHLPSSGHCYIASATPKECYIHDSSSSADLDVITEQLASIDISDVNCELKDVKVGDLVGACHDDVVYRASITQLDPPEVYFIDYGNTSPATKFFKLPDPIKNKKPLAMKVKLDLGEGVELNDDGLIELQNLTLDGANYTQTRPSVVELSVGGSKIEDLLKSYLVIADSSGDASQSKASTIAPAATNAVIEVEYVPITISHVNSPSDFYYQLDLPKVTEMSSRLADTEGFLPVEKCDVGQVICGKYSEDELWYRAKILTTDPSVTVLFLDYGNIAEVEEMKQLPDDLAKIPPLSVKASLKPQEQQWTEDEANKFLEIAYGTADFTCSIIENCADVVIIRLNSSEVGDVTTHLDRSCSIKTSDSEYGTPDVLSVDDMVPPVQYEESAVVDDSSLIDQQIASLMSSAQGEEMPFQLINNFPENSQVRSDDVVEPKLESLSPSETENVSLSKTSSRNSKPSSLIHVEDNIEIPIIESGCLASDTSIQNQNEPGSIDMLSELAKSNQASPTLATPPESSVFNYETVRAMNNDGTISKGDESGDVRDNIKDGEIVQTLPLPLPESESRVQEKIETLGKPCPTETIEEINPENEQLAECQYVDVSLQSNSSSRALMIRSAQATLVVAPPSLDSPSITDLEAPEDSRTSLVDESLSTADLLPSKPEIPVSLVSDESQNVPESSSFFRLPNLKETLLSVIGCESSVTSTIHEQTASDSRSSSDTIILSESETYDENSQSEIMNCSTIVHASTTLDRLSESVELYAILENQSYLDDQSVENVLPSSPVLVESVGELATEHFSSDVDGSLADGEQTVTEPKKPTVSLNVKSGDGKPETGVASMIEQDTSLKGSTSENVDELKTAEEVLITQPPPTSVVCMKEESNSKTNLPSNTNETDVSFIAPMAESGKVVAEYVSNDEQLSPDAYIEPREQTTGSSSMGVVDSPVKPDFSGNTSNQDVSNDECIVISGMTVADFLALPRPEATLDDVLDELIDDFIDDLPLSDEPKITLPAHTTTKDEEKITAPSHLVDKSEDWKTELNVTGSIVVVDPVVSGNTTTDAKTEGIEKSTVSKEQEIAIVKPAPKTSSTSVVCMKEENNSKTNLPSNTNKTDVSFIAPMADSGKVVAEYVSNDKVLLREEQLSPDAYIEPREQITGPSRMGVVDSPVKPDFSGNTSNKDVSIDECNVISGMTMADFLALPKAEATFDDVLDELIDDSPLSGEPKITLPAHTTTKDEQKITAPSHLVDKSEDWKTELNVTGSIVVDPVVSGNTTTHAKTEGVEKSTVSKEQEIAIVKPATKTSSTITDPRKKTTVKTVAQIKASAKPRISTGRLASSNSKNKPPSKSGSPSTPSMPPKASSSTATSPQSSSTLPRSSSERDRIIPGTVNGRTSAERDRIIPGTVSGRMA